jgi:hypothetical protein
MLFHLPPDTKEDILKIRIAALEVAKNGGLYMQEYACENTTIKKAFGIPLKFLLGQTWLYLQTYYSEEYGPVVTRTRPNFYTWY